MYRGGYRNVAANSLFSEDTNRITWLLSCILFCILCSVTNEATRAKNIKYAKSHIIVIYRQLQLSFFLSFTPEILCAFGNNSISCCMARQGHSGNDTLNLERCQRFCVYRFFLLVSFRLVMDLQRLVFLGRRHYKSVIIASHLIETSSSDIGLNYLAVM